MGRGSTVVSFVLSASSVNPEKKGKKNNDRTTVTDTFGTSDTEETHSTRSEKKGPRP
jgi:hypothetical protein